MSVKISHYGVSSVATRKYADTMSILSPLFQCTSDHIHHHSAAIIFFTLINQIMAHTLLLLILKSGEIILVMQKGYGHPDFEHKIGITPCPVLIHSRFWDYGTVFVFTSIQSTLKVGSYTCLVTLPYCNSYQSNAEKRMQGITVTFISCIDASKRGGGIC